ELCGTCVVAALARFHDAVEETVRVLAHVTRQRRWRTRPAARGERCCLGLRRVVPEEHRHNHAQDDDDENAAGDQPRRVGRTTGGTCCRGRSAGRRSALVAEPGTARERSAAAPTGRALQWCTAVGAEFAVALTAASGAFHAAKLHLRRNPRKGAEDGPVSRRRISCAGVSGPTEGE